MIDNADFVAALTVRLVAFSTIMVSVEILAMRRQFHPGAVLGWEAVQMYGGLTNRENALRLRGLLKYRVYLWLQILALVAGLALFAVPDSPLLQSVCLGTILLSNIAGTLRHPGFAHTGNAGASMRNVVLMALFFRSLAPGSARVGAMTLQYIACQCTLAYFIAGATKLASPEWRRGRALTGIMTRYRKDGMLPGILRAKPRMAALINWSVIVIEVGLPIAVLFGPQAVLAVLLLLFLMHLGISQFMGLGQFTWAFLSAYPSIIYLSRWTFLPSLPS